jgi:Bifunctional DNA primase/polymerase, N-terminal
MISLETLTSYWKMGFKPVPLNELSKNPAIAWSEIYDNPDFWSIEKLTEHLYKFHNTATTFGQTHVTGSDGRKLYLYCLDIDSEEALKRVTTLLEQEWKPKTFVTKTQKDCGYHIYWFEHSDDKDPLSTEGCKKGFEFEIKCGKSLCTLPPSRHRDNPYFHYESVGQADKIMIADSLYERLINELLVECIKTRKGKSKKNYNVTEVSHNEDPLKQPHIASPDTKIADNIRTIDDRLDPYVTPSSNIPRKVLSDKQIERSVQYLIPYYQEKTRDKFAFGFSGLAYKEDIEELSAANILQSICTIKKDAETDSRLDTLHRTYIKGCETGSENITGRTKLKEVIIYVAGCDEEAAENIIQDLINIWSENAETKIKHNTAEHDDKNHQNNINKKQSSSVTGTLSQELIAAGIHCPTEYAISIINKTVKCDDSLVRAVFYAGCSTWTFDPLNLGISAPTSEGKTYTVTQVLQYFPHKDVKYIGSMSPKVIIRQDSILVDADTLKPIQSDIDVLKKQINKEKKENRKEELEQQLQDLMTNACPLIDLRGRIYVFLEPPDPELWQIIRPIMSHDKFVIDHPFVDSNTFQGIHVKSIKTLGYHTFIFCTAKDESKWEQWDEIVSRSLIMSPNMSSRKYIESTILSAQQIGLPTAMQEAIIRSRREVDLAQKCVLYLKDSISQTATLRREEEGPKNVLYEGYDFTYNNPVWIPYTEILGAALPAEKGTEMNTNRRLLLLLRVIALVKANQRYQFVFDSQTQTVAAPEDLTEALYIMQNSSGLPPYKVKFFNEIFYPLYQKKLEEQQIVSDIVIEVRPSGEEKSSKTIQKDTSATIASSSSVTLTANEICQYYNLKNPQTPINSDNLRKTYLNELVSAGWIEALDVRDGNTKKAYYPIVAPLGQEEEIKNRDITQETTESKIDPEFFIHHKINVPIDYIPLTENWLNIEVLRLWKCGIDISNGPYYSTSLTYANNSNHNNNGDPIQEKGQEVSPSIAAAIQFLDIEREEGEEKEGVEDENNNNDKNGSSTISNSNLSNNKRKKITMTQFVQRYNSPTDSLSRHFSRPIFSDSYNKIFGKIQYIGILPNNTITNSGNYY